MRASSSCQTLIKVFESYASIRFEHCDRRVRSHIRRFLMTDQLLSPLANDSVSFVSTLFLFSGRSGFIASLRRR